MYSTSTQAATKARWDSFSSAIGQSPKMMLQYVDKDHPRSQWLSDQQWVVGSWKASPWLSGVTPVIGLPMATSKASAIADFRSIASGGWDATINGIFKSWADAGYTDLYLRPGWEMNGDWYAWGVTNANAADFAAAFRRIADLAHKYTGAKITVVWNPNVGDPGSEHVPFALYYPGDAYVDVVGIDIYGMPINSDSSPDDNASRSSDYTLRAAIDFARTHGKPLGLPEVGGANSTFPGNLANEIVARGASIDFMGIWAMQDEFGWSDDPGDTAAWKAAYAKINAAGGETGSNPTNPPTPPPSDVVERQTLSLVLSEDRWNGDAKFVVLVDGNRIGNGTVTASHAAGRTQTFNFTRNWIVGKHDIRIDFINDANGGSSSRDRNLYVDQVRFDGVGYLTQSYALKTNGSFSLSVDSGGT